MILLAYRVQKANIYVGRHGFFLLRGRQGEPINRGIEIPIDLFET